MFPCDNAYLLQSGKEDYEQSFLFLELEKKGKENEANEESRPWFLSSQFFLLPVSASSSTNREKEERLV